MLLRHEAKRHGIEDLAVSSAGLLVSPGDIADSRMVNYLSEIGVPAGYREARRLTDEDVQCADLILVMERGHGQAIVGQWPEALEKVELLGSYISEGPVVDDIIDPYMRSPYHYRLAQSQIGLAVRSLIKSFLAPKDSEAFP